MNEKTPKSLKDLLDLVSKAKSEGADVKFVNAETGEEGIPEELAEMLGKAALNMGGNEECPSCHEVHGSDGHAQKPTAELANALLDIAAAHAKPPVFQRGQFIRFRKDVQYVRRSRDLHIVLDNVDPPIVLPISHEQSGDPTSYRRLNVVIGSMTDHGAVRYYADSRELEIYPDADKLLGKNS